ncbi:MOSC domain-containing protein [Pseudoduganella umbonata]|uniref:MOSC domain-containing protein n=1 Tax=Pseudoduganella umbonata TaxID=864828 RepID=A0A4P8HLT1_9BURK|nr:MOSC domain-containing protein [Pseudoduganella umbonata]MBB3224980.1 MOSC domain-containing protein YiiM [Pseudoduganella umbonata]QCP09250.1 MOSC domain-containing protein [Pseudoduganella umbonata]
MPSSIPLAALFTGPARPLSRTGHPNVASGIVKSARPGPVRLSLTGLEGDEQGDRAYHGGLEKAVHHYAGEHYAMWAARWPDSPVPLVPGAFGENVATFGMTEANVHIGDVFRLGSALLQVSQGRQPCWKLNRRFGRDDAAAAMQGSGRTGWYYRVLEEGVIARGNRFELAERPCPAWPLERLVRALFPRLVPTGLAIEDLRGEWALAAALAPLSPNWRAAFAKRLDTGRIEDWSRRLREAPIGN